MELRRLPASPRTVLLCRPDAGQVVRRDIGLTGRVPKRPGVPYRVVDVPCEAARTGTALEAGRCGVVAAAPAMTQRRERSAGSGYGLGAVLMRMPSAASCWWPDTACVEVFRGVSALLVSVGVGVGVPMAFPGVAAPAGVVGHVGPAPVAGARLGETVRAGALAVPPGQIEAVRSVGMSDARALLSVVLPRALRIMAPLTVVVQRLEARRRRSANGT